MKIYLSIIVSFISVICKSQRMTVNQINYQMTGDHKAMVVKGSYSGNIIIPDKITFQDVTYVIEALGYDSFSGSHQLISVKLPESIRNIEGRAFEDCINLTSINFPKSLQRIENAAFFKCDQLKKVIIPENVEFISPNAFSYCSSLQEISVVPKNKFYASKDGVLYDKTFKILIKVPDTKSEVNIPDTVEKFFPSTFENCRFLSKIELPLSVKDIPTFSFDNCKALKEFNIHQNIKTIGWDIFRNAESLKKFTVDSLNPNFSIEDDVLYDQEKINLLRFPPAKEKIIIPPTVKNIATSAFNTNKYLKEITIPETVEKINIWAFANCPLLTKITILAKKPTYMSEAFQISRKITFYVPKETVEEYKKSNDSSWKNANYVGI